MNGSRLTFVHKTRGHTFVSSSSSTHASQLHLYKGGKLKSQGYIISD